MLHTVFVTLVEQHNHWIVALAAMVCALSAFAGVALLNHAQRSSGRTRSIWLSIAAISVGFGIWTTHFVAMMAYSAGMPTSYDFTLTVVSLLIAVGIVGTGLWFATVGTRRSDAALGGAVVGVGIASMHYTGMASLLIGGNIIWDQWMVGTSVLLGMAYGAAALHVATQRGLRLRRLAGAGLLTFAICAMHFTGMGAADLSNCFPIVSETEQAPEWLSVVVAVVSILILVLVMAAVLIDLREQRRGKEEAQRLRDLADAAVEGLLVTLAGHIVTANRSFLRMVGQADGDVTGQRLATFLPDAREAMSGPLDTPIEATLRSSDGRDVPVELIRREVNFGGHTRDAIAVRDLSARKQAESHIRYLAHHDALTGLPNRPSFERLLHDEIIHARRMGQTFALLCLDLDRFKEVNDLFGHPEGDTLLQRVGNAIVNSIGEHGQAARLGGDEFAVLLTDIGTPGRAGRLAENILEAIRSGNAPGGGAMAGASIGIVVSDGKGIEPDQLMSQADTALYRAKQDGRGVYRFYAQEMGAQVRDRRLLEHDMRHALSLKQMHLVYQPQVDIRKNAVSGFEALLRWHHPQRGEVSPAMFVPVAEESGLIMQIGEWVLRTAASEAARWAPHLSVAVNVSAVQLHATGFADTVGRVLSETGLDPTRLEIEITETALIRDMGRAVAALHQIRDLGVRIAMDDFGTGYSSLANLRAFPFSKIKVDQSFIRSVDRNSQSAAIVRAVLGLGVGLDVPVVAEGVERPEELAFLRDEVCQSAQGYLLSRPERIEAFTEITSGSASMLAGWPDKDTVLEAV